MIKKILKKMIFKFCLASTKKVDYPIVVFESDDWGSIRNSSRREIEEIQKKYNLQLDNYQALDCLEKDEDIDKLMSVLKKHRNNLLLIIHN